MKLIGLEPGQLYVLLLPEGDYGTAHRTAQTFREQVAGMANPPRVVVLLGDVELVGVRELSPEQHAAVAAALATAEPHEAMPDPISAPVWQPVKSSNIGAVLYDPAKFFLYVRFREGAVYRYAAVDRQEFDRFLNAASKGAHLAKEIKPLYPVKRLQPEEVPS